MVQSIPTLCREGHWKTELKYWEHSSVGSEHLPYKQRVTGSNPVAPTLKPHYCGFFVMAYFYILHSSTLDKYYIGATSDVLEERLRRHLTAHNGFTSKAKDWKLVYSEHYDDIKEALKRERQVKGWKSKSMINKLISGM